MNAAKNIPTVTYPYDRDQRAAIFTGEKDIADFRRRQKLYGNFKQAKEQYEKKLKDLRYSRTAKAPQYPIEWKALEDKLFYPEKHDVPCYDAGSFIFKLFLDQIDPATGKAPVKEPA